MNEQQPKTPTPSDRPPLQPPPSNPQNRGQDGHAEVRGSRNLTTRPVLTDADYVPEN